MDDSKGPNDMEDSRVLIQFHQDITTSMTKSRDIQIMDPDDDPKIMDHDDGPKQPQICNISADASAENVQMVVAVLKK
ncbi:hypothetical protein ACOSQ2_032969 [Xanthoceras sorbifolium]